jgi:hypothetical protein
MAANTMVTAEPLFFGQQGGSPPAGSCTPEDYIRRCDDFQRANAWTDAQAAAHAISYLRGPAAFWFNTALAYGKTREHADASGSYLVYKRIFQTHYFRITSKSQVSTDWSTLKQLHAETAKEFATRVLGTLAQYAQLIIARDAEVHELQRLTAATALAFAPNVAADVRNEVNAAVQDYGHIMQKVGTHSVIMDLVHKMTAAGLNNPRLAEVVRKMERKNASYDEVIQALDDADRQYTKLSNSIPKSSLPTFKGLGAIESEQEGRYDEEQNEIQAIAQRKQRARGPPKAQPQANGNRQAAAPAAPRKRMPGAFCDYCKKRDSHVAEECFKRKADIKNAAKRGGPHGQAEVSRPMAIEYISNVGHSGKDQQIL